MRRGVRILVCCGWLALPAGAAWGQEVPAAVLQQLDQLVGSRVESFAILGTQTGASGGLYKGDVNDTKGDVFKLAGRGDVTPRFPLGDSGVQWSVLVEGGFGRVLFDNRFQTQPLAGNRSEIETWSVALGVGVRLTVLDVLSVAPSIGGIYSHTENTFAPGTPLGDTVKQRLGGTLVDWNADTFTLVPGVEGRYRQAFGPAQLTLTSVYKYFRTDPISRSTTALSFESESHWWRNELDTEVKLPLHVFGRQLRVGGYVARSELSGGLETSLKTDHLYDAGGRLVVDLVGLLWKLEYLGIGASYFFSDSFSGWSYGVEVSFKF
jgi:hypothetical protein